MDKRAKRTRSEVGGPDLDGILAYRDRKYDEYKRSCFLPKDQVLTDKEFTLLLLASYGYTAEESGIIMYFSLETVKSYRKNLFLKMNVRSMNHAIGQAGRQDLI